MKEVTYEDWQKNPTPRTMWVWDNIENNIDDFDVFGSCWRVNPYICGFRWK